MSELHPWAERYREGETPWDLGGAHPELVARIAAGGSAITPPASGGKALVPGCGRGWDALALAQAGWEVTALDIVPDLGPLVSSRLSPYGSTFHCGDFLNFQDCDSKVKRQYDLIFDHTFFCALPPEQRAEFGLAAARLLKPGATLFSLVFPIGRDPALGGPPFGMEIADLCNCLLPLNFQLVNKTENVLAGEGRKWPEAWAEFFLSSH
jgi:SAM-dependent methyltransferase